MCRAGVRTNLPHLCSRGPHLLSTADSRYRWRPRMLSWIRTNKSSSGSSHAAPSARQKAATLSSSQAASFSSWVSGALPCFDRLRCTRRGHAAAWRLRHAGQQGPNVTAWRALGAGSQEVCQLCFEQSRQAAHRSRSSGPSTSAARVKARESAGSSDGSVVVSAISCMLSKWCWR